MVLVIPMSGQGKRFLSAGYDDPKPLIKVDGKPIIAHVLDMYPGEENVIFICNEEHLAKTNMRQILTSLRPNSKIISLSRNELGPIGPVAAIMQAKDYIPDNEEVLVSYCDFTGTWDYQGFRKAIKESKADGAIPAYIGFHPHLLGPNYYGHMRWGKNNKMLEIKEKSSFTDNKMNEYAAVGSYWFRSGSIMKKYFAEALALDMKTGKEFFCSLPYNLLVRDNMHVIIHEMPYFCQWGTPEDLEEYESWSRAFAQLAGNPKGKGTTSIPAHREPLVKARVTVPKDQQQTFAYWQNFFSHVPWHPYGKNTNDYNSKI